MNDTLLGVLIAGVLSILGSLVLFALQEFVYHKKKKIELIKNNNESRLQLRIKQIELLQFASSIDKFSKLKEEKYSKFLDNRIYLESYYFSSGGNFGVFFNLREAISKLCDLVSAYIKSKNESEKIKIKEDIDLCVYYLQKYFDKIFEGFRVKSRNITKYCSQLYENKQLQAIEEKLNMLTGDDIKI